MSVVVRNAIVKYLKNEGIRIGEEEIKEKSEKEKVEAKTEETKPGLVIIPKK